MHLCFVDESGHPPKQQKIGQRPFFVIAGVIMHEDQWPSVASEMNALRAKPEYRVSGEIKWRYFGPENTDRDNSVAHLDADARAKFRKELFSIITKRKSIRIVSCVCDCRLAFQRKFIVGPEHIYRYTYKSVSERFQYYLQDTSRMVGSKQHGIIVADHRGTDQDKALRKHHHDLVDDEALFVSDYKNYIETVFLTPSHHSVGIQLADMVAGAIGRAFNTPEKEYADLLHGSFRSRPDGSIDGYGLVKFPGGW